MAGNGKVRSPASVLILDKEMANKLYIQPPKSSIKPQSRNPITQDYLEVSTDSKQQSSDFMYSTQGIAMGTFAEKYKKSDIFGVAENHKKTSKGSISSSNSEASIPIASFKKSEYQPPIRNPITQDSISPYNPQIRTKCSQSTAFSHLFEQRNEEHKPRSNI